jgi:hypothetical protein
MFEAKLREYLADQDRDWLIEQIVRLTLDAHSLYEMDRRHNEESKARSRHERIERVRKLDFDREKLVHFIKAHEAFDRSALIANGYLIRPSPVKGTQMLDDDCRTLNGNELLMYAKDVLFALLFGDETTNTHLVRIQRELLTLTVPRDKVEAIDFMKATTELSAYGTWQDPESVSNDQHADNVLLEVEYGEIEGELVGHGIVRALSLINNLEINEQVLYARMVNIEETTLIA